MRGLLAVLAVVAAACLLPSLARAAAPANDSYTTPEVISGASGTVFGTRAEATAEAAEVPAMPHYHSIWYAWTAPGYGTVSFDTAGTAWAWVFEDGRLENASMKINGQRYGFFNAKAGVTYLIGLDDWNDGGPTQFGWNYVETPPPPANDDWTSPQALDGASGTVSLDTRGATRQDCDGDLGYGYSVWYSWVAPESGELTIQAIADVRGTIAGVYTYDGSTPCAVQIARSGGDPSVANVVAGERYLFGVDTWGDTGGPTSFTYSFSTVERPANDDFANAAPLGTAHRGSVSGSALHATPEPGEWTPFFGHTVWYAWTPDVDGSASVDFSLGDGVVYTGASLDTLQTVAYDGGRFDVTGGTTYYIQVAASGDYVVDWLLEPNTAPPNDLYANAQSIDGDSGYVESTNRFATFESGEPSHGGTSTASVWFTWKAPADGNMVFWVDSSSWAVVQAYVGTKLTTLTPVPGERQEPEAQRVSFPAVAGTIYKIAVDSRAGGTSVFWLGWRTDTSSPPSGAQPDTLSTDEDVPLIIEPDQLLANDADADGAPVSFQFAASDPDGHGIVTFDDFGDLVFMPDANFNGDGHFSYTVIDGTGVETTATVTVQVAPVNDPPSATLTAATASIAEGGQTTLDAAVTDVDGDKLTYSWSATTGDLVDDGASATLAVDDGPAVSTVQVVVSDGNETVAATADVTVTNVAPQVSVKAPSGGAWGVPLSFTGTVRDPSNADRAGGLSPTWAFDGSSTVTGLKATHAFDVPGAHRVTFTATDKDGGSSTRTVTVKIVQRGSTLAYTGPASAPFGFGTVSAKLGDAVDPATAQLDGHALSFTAGGVSFGGSTSGGTGGAAIGGALLPGRYAVDAQFAGDKLYGPSSASGSLAVVNSAGKVTGDAALGDGTPLTFSVSGDGAAVRGAFSAGAFSASSVTALGIVGHVAWFAGTGTDGRAFVASVDDAGEPGVGVDAVRVWIDGALQPGSGTIAAGNVQLH
jgi:hypothetical protein